MSIPEKYKYFKKYFDLNFGEFIDELFLMIDNTDPVLDIIKFDDWLKERYPDEYTDDMSTMDFIRTKYGECQLSFIETLIK